MARNIDDAIPDIGGAPSWDAIIAQMNGEPVGDFSFMYTGPLALEGVEMPVDALDFKWGRNRRANGEDDVVNIGSNEKTGWRPVPRDMLHLAKPLARGNSMHGGISVGGMQLLMRSKRNSARVRDQLNALAEDSLDNVVTQYDQRISKTGLMSSQMPRSTFDDGRDSREYRGREAVAQMDAD